jgi:hypothetical protein
MAQYPLLKYITFEQLMSSVEQDMELYSTENMIDRQRLIKIVKEVNSDLGIKINREVDVLIEVKNKKADLPLDFMYLQAIFLCEATSKVRRPGIGGDHVEQKSVDPFSVNVPCYGDGVICPTGSYTDDCGKCYVLAKRPQSEEETEYMITYPVRLTERALSTCGQRACLGGDYGKLAYEVDINEGVVLTNFEKGTLYVSYLADMVDENNNILIMDHPLVRPYYEYAIKKRLLENWFLTNDAEVGDKLKYIIQMMQQARLQANNYVNGIGYKEVIDHFNNKRGGFLRKYVNMFGNNVY